MAKKWIPSQKQLSLYDELLRRQNITRKRLLKIRRITESEASSYGGGLPDLVIPKKARRYRDLTRYRFDSYREYRLAMAKLKAEFSDFELSFGKQHYFTNYKNEKKLILKLFLQFHLLYLISLYQTQQI